MRLVFAQQQDGLLMSGQNFCLPGFKPAGTMDGFDIPHHDGEWFDRTMLEAAKPGNRFSFVASQQR